MKKRRKKSYCFNCNTSLSKEDNFCRRCGQENHDKTVSLKMLINDFLGDYLTFDSKIWRSLRLLCFSPGQLTINYSEGKITQYIRPIRLMLFMSLIYVLCFSLFLDNQAPLISNDNIYVVGGKSGTEFYKYILDTYGSVEKYIKKEQAQESFLVKEMTKGVFNLVGGNKNIFNEVLKKITNLLFFLLPVVALLFQITFWRNKYYYVEHFVHVLHIYSFFFLISLIGMVFSFAVPIAIIMLCFLPVFYYYLFLSYRKVYQRSIFVTILKVFTTSIGFYLLLFFGFIASLVVTIALS